MVYNSLSICNDNRWRKLLLQFDYVLHDYVYIYSDDYIQEDHISEML